MEKPQLEELDYRRTLLGELILRKRTVPSLGHVEVFEVKLDGAFLMSSLNNTTEVALAELPLAKLGEGPFDILIGGLGLGYTAKAALDCDNVRAVTVVEVLPEVIDWHRRGLVPLGASLTKDPRCRILQGDFFEWAWSSEPAPDAQRYDAILVDIDHSPEYLLDPAHQRFYELEGLRQLRRRLAPGGVFALWSADPPEDAFVWRLESAFDAVAVESVSFYDPLYNEQDANTIYMARAADSA